MKGPSEDGLRNSIRKGRELGKPLVVAGCVPQGQKNHPDIQGLSVVGVGGEKGAKDKAHSSGDNSSRAILISVVAVRSGGEAGAYELSPTVQLKVILF